MTEVNIPLLRKGVEWVEEQDALPNQGYWNQNTWVFPCRRSECGTAYCFAGYLGQSLNPAFQKEAWVEIDGELTHVSEFAKQALGLTKEQANRLFKKGNTAEDIRRLAEEFAGENL